MVGRFAALTRRPVGLARYTPRMDEGQTAFHSRVAYVDLVAVLIIGVLIIVIWKSPVAMASGTTRPQRPARCHGTTGFEPPAEAPLAIR